ncbi:hypothetical protein PENSPDRAFT_376926 [Peniophora sp. CONT]|nr:hypothetical protein PENSPDRAFT_376926 [Peniophora sp. CONT]
MYAISLSHWAASISLYKESVEAAVNPLQSGEYIGTGYIGINSTVALLTSACLAVNITLSDAIVLWRMYIVWDRARFTVALSAALISTTSALAIANLVGLAGVVNNGTNNMLDSEVLPTFGANSIGLAAAYMSLASNVCATLLVGLKAWLLRKELLARRGPASPSQRTTIERVMELLIDSGVAYTAIWLLYLISFFRAVTTYSPVHEDRDTPFDPITAVAHLDAAMAQLTTIYPLIILLLIGINKAHHTREPRLIREQNSTFALTVNIDPDMDMEGSKMLDPEVNDRVQPGESGTKHVWQESKDVW